jgi:stalled ribosome rescue protein Dom34
MWRRGRDEERNQRRDRAVEEKKKDRWHLRATEEEGDTREIKETRNERRGRTGDGDRRKTNLFFG